MSRFGQFHEIPDLPENAFCENKYEFTLEGGGKGGGSSQTVVEAQEIPKWVEEPATRNLARAEAAQKIGYQPYYGPDIAAFNPTQQAAFGSTIGGAEAFGLIPRGSLQPLQGLPQPTTYAGGMQAYSAAPLYEQALAEYQARQPTQAAAYRNLFV
jgi:hypothetical protein